MFSRLWSNNQLEKLGKAIGNNTLVQAFNEKLNSYMNDHALASTLCDRLNTALENPEMVEVLTKLLQHKVEVSSELDFPEYKLRVEGNKVFLSTLGLINGLLSTHTVVAVLDKKTRKVSSFKVKET